MSSMTFNFTKGVGHIFISAVYRADVHEHVFRLILVRLLICFDVHESLEANVNRKQLFHFFFFHSRQSFRYTV